MPDRIEPATRLPAATAMGPVHLAVTDLARSLAYYTERIGLAIRSREGERVWLGAGESDVLALTVEPEALRASGAAGLFHVALLLPARASLGATLHHLIESRTPIDGASDHGVSEALYLSDPDGNGLELYCDRPRDDWPRVAGRLSMSTEPLDGDGLLAEGGPVRESWRGLPAGTRVGHVHLRVQHVDAAERFYVEVVGFDRVQRYGPSAAFVSAGGYHHHVGLNNWGGVSGPAPPGAVGLRRFEVLLPDAAALDALRGRLLAAGHAAEPAEGGVESADPSGNRVRFTLAP